MPDPLDFVKNILLLKRSKNFSLPSKKLYKFYYIYKINNTQIDNAEYIDIVMPMYNLIAYGNNYSKISGSLWQYCIEISAVNNNG